MVLLILGLLLWWAAHLLKVWAPDRRAGLTASIGLGASRGAMAVVILCALALMVIGYQQADFVSVWYPPAFLVHVNNLLMVVAVFIYIAGFFPSVVRRKIRHPQLIGTKTWALAHLLVNGDLASIVLFGGLLAWTVVSMIGINKRDGARGELPAATMLGLGIHVAATVVLFLGIT